MRVGLFITVLLGAVTGAFQPVCGETAPSSPGLALTLTSSGATDTRVARMAALYVPAGDAASPFLKPGPFKATFSGAPVVPKRSRLMFTAAGRGSIRLSVDGKVVLDGAGDLAEVAGKWVRLSSGPRRFELEYTAPAGGDAQVRIYWQSAAFLPETIPPLQFTHDPASPALQVGLARREGRHLFAQRQCSKCHLPDDEAALTSAGMPELAADAPAFADIGARLSPSWMTQWIINPKRLRPTATMPNILGHADLEAAAAKNDTRAQDMAAYLATLGADKVAADPKFTLAQAQAGGTRFAQLGCFNCHTLPDNDTVDTEHDRIPLHNVAWKWKPAALVTFLQKPNRHYQWTRMPDFAWSDEEATLLAAYLLTDAKAKAPTSAAPAGDTARGGKAVRELGCLNCHDLPEAPAPVNEFKAAPLAKLTANADAWPKRGCTATGPHQGGYPLLDLSEQEKQALHQFAAAGLESLERHTPAEYANRQINNLNCVACHNRDGASARWLTLEEEVAYMLAVLPPAGDEDDDEGYGDDDDYGAEEEVVVVDPAQRRPHLTYTGEQLHTGWMASFITGGLEYRTRPWLAERMPAFAAQGKLLAEGLSHDHGFAAAPDAAQAKPPAETVALGEILVGPAGGLNCRSCHGVGVAPATTRADFPAINLQRARTRLRYGYFQRWLLNPQRIYPGTPMPTFAGPQGKTALKEVAGGDAKQQFDAVWHYLSTVPEAGSAPAK